MFADPGIQGIMAVGGGAGGARLLPRLDYGLIRRHPKVLCGFSDVTALLAAVQARTGLVTFHGPMAASDWGAYTTAQFKAVVMEAEAAWLRNPSPSADALAPREGRIATLRPGAARGTLLGGNLAVLAGLAGSPYWPAFDGAILFLEEVNEYLYRVDRMLSTLKLAGALDRVAGVVIGAFTRCTPGEGYGTLTLDEILDDHLRPLGVPVFTGASFGHIRNKLTLPVGLPVEMNADAGHIRLLEPAVT
jgi:muramoyltetrapeptide carboxypeptidase